MTWIARHAWGVPAAVAVAVVACADQIPPTAPAASTRPTPSTLASSADPSAPVVTVIDEVTGDQYVLDVAAREMRVSGNEQTAQVASAFYGTVASDPVAADLETLQYEGGGGGCDPATDPDCYQDAGGVGGESTFLIRKLSTGPTWTHHGAGRNLQFAFEGGHAPPSPGRGRAGIPRTSGDVGITSLGDPCADVVNAVLPSVSDYKSVRTRFVHHIVEGAVSEIVNGVQGKVIRPGSGVAIAVETAIADHYYVRVSMGVLALYWNAYNCGSKHVTAGPFIRTGSGGGGGALVCHYETWEISFDGGRTWSNINVTVCEYQVQ